MRTGSCTGLCCGAVSGTALKITLTRSAAIGRRAANWRSYSDTHTMWLVKGANANSVSHAAQRCSRGTSGLKPKPCTV